MRHDFSAVIDLHSRCRTCGEAFTLAALCLQPELMESCSGVPSWMREQQQQQQSPKPVSVSDRRKRS